MNIGSHEKHLQYRALCEAEFLAKTDWGYIFMSHLESKKVCLWSLTSHILLESLPLDLSCCVLTQQSAGPPDAATWSCLMRVLVLLITVFTLYIIKQSVQLLKAPAWPNNAWLNPKLVIKQNESISLYLLSLLSSPSSHALRLPFLSTYCAIIRPSLVTI